MIKFGPWPLSLVGVPGAEISNTTPPHLPLLALAAFQFGFVLTVQDAVNKALKGQIVDRYRGIKWHDNDGIFVAQYSDDAIVRCGCSGRRNWLTV